MDITSLYLVNETDIYQSPWRVLYYDSNATLIIYRPLRDHLHPCEVKQYSVYFSNVHDSIVFSISHKNYIEIHQATYLFERSFLHI